MIHIFIGLVVGIIMGLTGAGGALISIPLFINLLDSSLKEATVLSLVAVLFGTSANLIGSLRKVDWKIVISFAVFGGLSNFFATGLKGKTPDIVIAVALCLVAIYSIVSVWQKKNDGDQKTVRKENFGKLLVTGLFLGILTTFTGLGGGVLLVPILIKFYGKSYHEALPTSLATIFLIALSSFLIQGETGFKLITFNELGLIGVGAVVSFIVLQKSLKLFKQEHVVLIRKIVFTGVTVYSIVSILIKSM